MTSVKIVTVDYYLSYPVKDLDVCYSEFRGTEVRQVPVLQIFGSTPNGTKTCLHVHGVLPYIYIPYDGVEPAARLSYQLAAEIDRTLNVALGQASANTCFVHNILLVSGIPLYGYHEREHQYFKIYFYNPMIVKKACSLLENGVILGKHFQPHESHINYVLQFMIDYNLQGMNYVNLSHVMYRLDTVNPNTLDAIPRHLILPASVQRRSFSRLECDALARDIVNIEEVSSGQLAVNPGLAALWEDEKQRRRNNELDSQISFCLTQDRPVPCGTASHRGFKQKLLEKLAQQRTHNTDSGSMLEQSVYPAETPSDVALLNASVVVSSETNTSSMNSTSRAVLSNEIITSSAESNNTTRQGDLSVLHLLQDLKANADATLLDDSLIENSQEEHDADLFKLLRELREGASVEEDSILSQTLVQHEQEQPPSEDEQNEENLSLPMKVTEFDDDDSVWENSFWDENSEIPQMDGQCDNSSSSSSGSSSSNSSSSGSSSSSDSSSEDEIDKSPVLPDIIQPVQMTEDKHYTINLADYSVSDSEEDVNDSAKNTDILSTNIQQDDNCCFPDTDTQSSEQATLRRANEVYLGQNCSGTLTNSQLLAPGSNILKPISPRRTGERKKKIEFTEVIIKPGQCRLTKDLCSAQNEKKSKIDNINKTIDKNNKIIENNCKIIDNNRKIIYYNNKIMESNKTIVNNKTVDNNKIIGNNNKTINKNNKTVDNNSKTINSNNKTVDNNKTIVNNKTIDKNNKIIDNNKTDSATTMVTTENETNINPPRRNNTWNTHFTNVLATINVNNIKQSSPKDTPANTRRPRRRRRYPKLSKARNPRSKTKYCAYRFKKQQDTTNADTYELRPKHGCLTKTQRTVSDTGTGCVKKRRKRNYNKKVCKPAGKKAKVAQQSTTLKDTVEVVNCAGETQNLTIANTAEHVNGCSETGNADMDLSNGNNTTSCAMRMKRKHAAQCVNFVRQIQQIESSYEPEVDVQRYVPVKRNKRTGLSWKVAQIRALQRKARQLKRETSRLDGTSERMRLAIRIKRLQQAVLSEQDGENAQYYCEMIGTANCVDENTNEDDTPQHTDNFDSLDTNVALDTRESIAASDNMSSEPTNSDGDNGVRYRVTQSTLWDNSSAAAPAESTSSSSSDSDESQPASDTSDSSDSSVATPPAAEDEVSSSSNRSHLIRTLRQKDCWQIYNGQDTTALETHSTNTSPALEQNYESNTAQNELVVRIRAIEQPTEDKAAGITDKQFNIWNVDGANDTLSSSDSSLTEQQASVVTRRRKQTGKANKSSHKPEETMNGSSDSDNVVKSVQKQTRSTSKQLLVKQQVKSPKLTTKQQVKSPKLTAKQQVNSTNLFTKQLQVNLVPLEFQTTLKSNDKHVLPMKQQLDKTANSNSFHGNTSYKAKSKPTRTSPRFSTLAVTIHSPKSKRNAKQTAEVDQKLIKIAKNLQKRQDSTGKDNTMASDRNVSSGELQMFGITPIIQNANTAKKPLKSHSLNSNTTCDIRDQTNSVPTSIISEPNQCDSTRINVKKQLFTTKAPAPPRKTIIVNINTDTNTTFVEEQKVCAYRNSRRNSVEPKFVQIQRLKDLIAKEEETFPATHNSGNMADDTFNFQRPADVPPSDIFEPAGDDTSSKDTCDSLSDANSVANLKYFLQNTMSYQYRDITSTCDSEPIAFNDQPVQRTRLDTPYVNSDFSSFANNVAQDEKTPENPPTQHQPEVVQWMPLICYEDQGELTTAQLYDLQCGFVPQPGTSRQFSSFVRCTRLYNTEYEEYDRSAEQAAIIQSLLEQQAKKLTELADMEYDPDCDGEPIIEEPVDDCSLPFEPVKESIGSDTHVSSTDDESTLVNTYDRSSYGIKEVDNVDVMETCDNVEIEYTFSANCDLLMESDKTEITTDSDIVPPVNGDETDDMIIEPTPAESTTQIYTLLHTTSVPSEIKTRLLMPKYHAPTRDDIMSSLAEYNIPECRYQEPYYSNPSDVTGKMDVGHNVLKIPSNTIQDLEEFKSCTGFPGLDAWRRERFKELYPDVDVSKINFRIAFAGQSKVVMLPGSEPPTRQEVEQWVEDKRQAASAKETPVKLTKPKRIIPLSPSADMDDSMSETMSLSPCTPSQSLLEDSQANLASQRKGSGNLQRRALFSQTVKPVLNLGDSSLHNNSHQITGVNLESKVDLQNLQHAKALSEPLNLTTMVVELYVRTRGDLYPDPQYDPVRAIFYSILNDMPAGAELPREETGVLVVNTLDDNSHANLLDGSGVTCTVLYVQSEPELIAAFVQVVRKWDPDICAGYEIEMHSWGYLIDRANVLGVNLTSELSRINPAVVKQRPPNSDSDQKDVQLTGRIILDVWRLLRHEVALYSYTFENIMYHILHRRVPKFSYQRLTFYWEYRRNFYRHITAKYYILRVQSVLQILEQLDLIGRTSELAKLFGIQFFEVLSRGSQFRVESMMLRLAKPLNYIPVSPSVTQRAKMRAPEFLPLIFEPESRFYADPVIVLDFQSLYPSIIIAYNYCFSTCIGRVDLLGSNQPFEFGACQLKVPPDTLRNLEHKLNFSPCGVGFVKPQVRQGILPRMLKEILETRLMVKSSMKANRDNKLLQRVLHSRQLGLKLIANVTYGYTAANFSGRMPCIEVGDSVVSKGRETLERAIKLIEQTPAWRAKVVYGDTDSVFVMVPGRSKDEAFRIGTEIAEAVTNDNPPPVKLKLEKVFLPCILQTKKRYVGYMYESVEQQEPEYCAKGIETVRRDGCPAVAKMLENTLRTLFETRDVSLVKRYVCRQFSKLLTGRVSIQDLTFAREYRGASGYRPGACVPALVLARRWAITDKRREPRRGERVPYVIVNGPPGLPLIRLVRCPRELLADPSRLRPNAVYYITRVIAPALNRCFTLIGADVLSWYNEMPRRQLQHLPTEDASNVKKSTISQYFATTSCASCGQQSRDGLCDNCAKDPQQSLVVLYMKINNWERTHDEVSLICESCCGRKTDCNSLDCPVLYRLNQVRRDLNQVPYVRKQIAKFTDE